MSTQFKEFKRRIVAVVEPGLAPLIKSLGVDEVIEVSGDAEASDAFRKAVMVEDVGIIITQKHVVERVPGSLLEEINSRVYPVVVVIPDNVDELKRNPVEIYRDLVRKFIGFEIYL